METCPSCGTIVMRGDPYCSHCGTTLRWHLDDDEEDDCRPPEKRNEKDMLFDAFNKLRNSDMTTDERFNLFRKYLFKPDHMLDEIRQEIDYDEKKYNCRFIMVYANTYPEVYIFLREDKFRDVLIFERCYVEQFPGRFDPEGREMHYRYTKLYNNKNFQHQVSEMERDGFRLADVSSDLDITRHDSMYAKFTNGYLDVTCRIDDDANLEKFLESPDIERLYNFDGPLREKNLLLEEIKRIEKRDKVKFMRASSYRHIAFSKANRIILYGYDFEKSKLKMEMSCTPEEFKNGYSHQYSFY